MTDDLDQLLVIANEGAEIIQTNYWQTEGHAHGLFFLSTNAGTMRLLVPAKWLQAVPEMTTGVVEVVLTRGRSEGVDDVVEVMFEDRSNTPYRLALDPGQLDRKWTPGDEGKRWAFAIYTEASGKVAEFTRCFLRSREALPCLEPWKGK